MRRMAGLAMLIWLGSGSPGAGQAPDDWAEFQHALSAYVALREQIEARLRPAHAAADPAELAAHREALARAIVEARRGDGRGSLLTPATVAAIRKLIEELYPGDRTVLRELIQEELAEHEEHVAMDPAATVVTVGVNQPVRTEAGISPMPPRLLERLPPLPEALDFRFLNDVLILRDHEAQLILDYVEGIVW